MRYPFRLFLCLIAVTCVCGSGVAEDLEVVPNVEPQPLSSQVKRVVDALGFLGQPLPNQVRTQLEAAIQAADSAAIQKALDPLVLAGVHINPEQRVKVARGAAPALLTEQGWSVFLIKVHNQAGITPQLEAASPNAAPLQRRSNSSKRPVQDITPADVVNRWLDLQMFDSQPLAKKLSGLAVEYRIVQMYSRDHGKREAKLSFHVGQGSQDLGFRNEIAVLFECAPAVKVVLDVLDDDGQPTTAQFVFRDSKGRVYPARSRRLAPDFFFHDQIYRASGEHVLLPPGDYQVVYSRGPEYRNLFRQITVPAGEQHRESFRLKRWIKLTDHGWFSGDHHVHAAGCAHYEAPTQGVTPAAMMRHILGEDLNVGCVLSWGPCWYYQKDFFEGDISKLSTKNYLMRYDVEVSGFPSQHAGHLCLLRLTDDDYTYPQDVKFDYSFGPERGTFQGRRTKLVGEWPSWDLPILQWGKKQGGVVGFSHSGWGLQLPDYMPDGSRRFPAGHWGGANPGWQGKAPDRLPDYAMPRFDGIGANEYVVDVVHDACDFISAVDTPFIWEMNIWYHTLNCGYQCRISGETDFPCIYGERVGLGRAYVKLQDQPLTFDNWVFGIQAGRSYCSDGLSHLIDFQVNGFEVGQKSPGGKPSVLSVDGGQTVKVTTKAAAFLDEQPNSQIRQRRLDEKPYWHVERARIGDSRKVPVQLIVNGEVVGEQEIVADGTVHDLTFDTELTKSSWVALRVFASSHTNPIFVEVDGQPIRANRRSAEWCRQAVDVCWKSKQGQIRAHEKAAAQAAFDVARRAYDQIIKESPEN